MAVNLSPVWGAGAQLLDNSGNVLSGGKIYTYAAGTTTPAVTYTSDTGATANSNPIVLNSAGRVPYEIWLTLGIRYKFVLKDSNDTLIGTWDNIEGVNSSFVAYTGQDEYQTATEGQTVFTLTEIEYLPDANNLIVFVDGLNQYGPDAQYAFVETDSTTVTFTQGLHKDALVRFTTVAMTSTNVIRAAGTDGQLQYNVDGQLGGFDYGTAGQVLTSQGDGLPPEWASSASGVTSVTATSPVASSGGTTPNISIAQATTSTSGYLSSTDWNTFNNKQDAGTYVTSVSATSPVASSGGTTPTISMPQASGSTSGYLSSTDWTTFNNKGSGTVTSVTGTSPIASSGGATPAISISQATTSTNGYLSSTDWNTFNGKQAALVSGTNIKTINTQSILGSGDLTVTASAAGSTGQVQYNNAGALGALPDGTAGQVLTSSGAGVAPTWTSVGGTGTVTSVDVSGGTTGLTTSGGPVTTSGTITLAGTLAVANGGTGQTSYTDGQLLIGNSTGNTLSKATLTAGSGVSITNGAGSITIAATGGTGDVVGPASATDNALVRFDGTTGKLIQNGLITADDAGNVANINALTFDTTPTTVPTAEGSLYWDSADGNQTLSLVMAGGNAIQQIGQEQYYRIKASAPITNGQVVMFTGTVGASGGLTGAPATGLTAETASYVMGIATQNMNTNDWGYVTSFGLVRNVDTSSFAAGNILYLNPSVAGGLTTTIPSAPNPKVQVCAVVYADASVGSLFVRTTFGGILGQYEGDVDVVTPANGQVLIRNQTAGKWVNATLTDGTGISITEGAGSITVTNSAPDQVVSLTAGTGIGVSGTYPSFTVSNSGVTAYPSSGIAVSTGSAWGTSKTAPSGDIVGTTDTQTLSGKTITGTKETVYTITDGAAFEIDPANGGIQTITLGASRTPAATNFTAGQSVTLMVDDGSAYTLTWTTVNPTWVGGSAPTLATSGYTVIEFWKVGTTIYGAYVGTVA